MGLVREPKVGERYRYTKGSGAAVLVTVIAVVGEVPAVTVVGANPTSFPMGGKSCSWNVQVEFPDGQRKLVNTKDLETLDSK